MVEDSLLNSTFVYYYVGAKPVEHESLDSVKLLPNLLVELLSTTMELVPMTSVEQALLLVHCSNICFHLIPIDAEVAIVWKMDDQGLPHLARGSSGS
jgi:hypothetical protein